MPRFKDEWVVTKSLFEYTTGGSCACCSFPAMFLPNGLQGLISSVSDLETDAADAELESAKSSPWPPEMRDHVWADRVKVRYKMKKEMATYKDFMVEIGGEEVLMKWCVEELGAQAMRRMFQMRRSEITEILTNKYGTCPAYGAIMGAVVEQVANFGVTKYDTDARGVEETAFEGMLAFSRRGGFMLKIAKKSSSAEEGGGDVIEVDNEVLSMFVSVMKSLGGPKLLHRAPSLSTSEDPESKDGADDTWKVDTKGKKGPSFRSDPRIARLIIARYWADQIISKYRISCKKEIVETE
eukprot:789733_1